VLMPYGSCSSSNKLTRCLTFLKWFVRLEHLRIVDHWDALYPVDLPVIDFSVCTQLTHLVIHASHAFHNNITLPKNLIYLDLTMTLVICNMDPSSTSLKYVKITMLSENMEVLQNLPDNCSLDYLCVFGCTIPNMHRWDVKICNIVCHTIDLMQWPSSVQLLHFHCVPTDTTELMKLSPKLRAICFPPFSVHNAGFKTLVVTCLMNPVLFPCLECIAIGDSLMSNNIKILFVVHKTNGC
jgi:hypothetical protein